MHDPRLPRGNGYPMSAARYQMDATPGRHMLSFGSFVIFRHCVNLTGMCFQGGWSGSKERLLGFLNAVTGWEMTMDQMLLAGGQHPACLQPARRHLRIELDAAPADCGQTAAGSRPAQRLHR